jgi:hypothetical protein
VASGPWPSPVIDGLLGEYLVAGTTGRLCIFGKNLHHVKTIMFLDPAIDARSVTVSDNEIMVDITAPVNIGVGKRRFFMRTKSGETCTGSDITLIFSRTSDASRGSPSDPPPYPCTPGFPDEKQRCPEQRSDTVERYYSDRPAVAGIGASLL